MIVVVDKVVTNNVTVWAFQAFEFFKMKTLKKFPKKRKIELTNADPVREDYVVETTFFSDTSTSSPERTILEESPRRSSFFKSLFRSSAR